MHAASLSGECALSDSGHLCSHSILHRRPCCLTDVTLSAMIPHRQAPATCPCLSTIVPHIIRDIAECRVHAWDLLNRLGVAGYGFMSENSRFAQRCEEEGIAFIGPRPETIQVQSRDIYAPTICNTM